MHILPNSLYVKTINI